MSGKNPLGLSKEAQAYEGANIVLPVQGWGYVRGKTNPTSSLTKFPLGTVYLNSVTGQSWMLNFAPGSWSPLNSPLVTVSGTSITMSAGTYICTSSSATTLTLPLTATYGTEITVIGAGSGGWSIHQNASQEIFGGTNHTTSGTGGNLAGGQYTAVTITATDTNNDGLVWIVTSLGQGTYTYT